MSNRIEIWRAVEIIDSILIRRRSFPEQVLKNDWSAVSFFESGEPLRTDFYKLLVQISNLVESHQFFYIPILPDTGYAGLPFTLSFSAKVRPASIDDSWEISGFPDAESPSSAGRYALVSMNKSWILYAERSVGLAFLAVAASVSELQRKRIQRILSDSGLVIGDLDALLSNRALPSMVGAAHWKNWAIRMRESYGHRTKGDGEN